METEETNAMSSFSVPSPASETMKPIKKGGNKMEDLRIINKNAIGLKNRNIDSLSLTEDQLRTAEDIREAIKDGRFETRSSRSGFETRNVADLESLGNIDIIGIKNKGYYVGDIKETNTMFNQAGDVRCININTAIVVQIGNPDVVRAQADRLSVGDRETYNRIMIDAGKNKEINGLRVTNKTNKALEFFMTIPEETVPVSKLENRLNNLFQNFQSLRDFIMTETEQSDIGKDPMFKTMALYLHTKDVAKFTIRQLDGDLTNDEVNQVIDTLFANAGVGPLSSMTLNIRFTVTRVVRTNNPEEYMDYDQHDKETNSLRSFVNNYDVKIPINPSILVKCSKIIENFKMYMLSELISLYNACMDPNAEVPVDMAPALEVTKHNLAGITDEEFMKFQSETLPAKVSEALGLYRQGVKTAAAKKITSSFVQE